MSFRSSLFHSEKKNKQQPNNKTTAVKKPKPTQKEGVHFESVAVVESPKKPQKKTTEMGRKIRFVIGQGQKRKKIKETTPATKRHPRSLASHSFSRLSAAISIANGADGVWPIFEAGRGSDAMLQITPSPTQSSPVKLAAKPNENPLNGVIPSKTQ